MPGGGFLEPSAHFRNGGGPVSGEVWQWRVMPTDLSALFYVTLFEIVTTAGSAGERFQGSNSQLHFALRVLLPICIKSHVQSAHFEKLHPWILTPSLGLLNTYRNTDVGKTSFDPAKIHMSSVDSLKWVQFCTFEVFRVRTTGCFFARRCSTLAVRPSHILWFVHDSFRV